MKNRILVAFVVGMMLSMTFAFAGTAVIDGASVSTAPSSQYFRNASTSDVVTAVSPQDPLPVTAVQSGAWSVNSTEAYTPTRTAVSFVAGQSNTTMLTGKNELCGVYCVANETVTETVNLTRVSSVGSGYNVLLDSVGLTANKHYVYTPNNVEVLGAGDNATIALSNATATATMNCTWVTKPIN